MKTFEKREQSVAKRREIRAAHISILGAVAVFLISVAVGLITDSVALLLDAGTGLVILLMAVFVRANLAKVGSPPDPRYNFGYEKYESLTVAIQNGAILFTCLIGIVFAVQDIIHPENVVRYDLPVLATLVSAGISLVLAAYLGHVSKATGSSMLRTAAVHWIVDASLSFAMCAGFLVGLFLSGAGYKAMSAYVDPAMAILLGLAIMASPLKALSGNLRELLDGVPEPSVHEQIKQAVQKHGAVFPGLHRMRVRKAGRRTFLDIGFKLSGGPTWEETQVLAENFEQALLREVPDCDVVVYFKR